MSPLRDTRRSRRASLPPRKPAARAFSLVEATISSIIVATMFAAGVAASGAATRDRMTQREIRLGAQLARTLMAEVTQQRYADPSPNTIVAYSGVSTVDRSNWTHIDDYYNFTETPPKDRSGVRIAGCDNWSWSCKVAYQPFASAAGSSGTSGGLISGILTPVIGAVSALVDLLQDSATDTGLKRIVVTVTSPRGKITRVTALRSSAGAVDRISTGFNTFANVSVTVGADSRPVTTGAPLLNTPSN